jgi:hypothetical protein
LAPVGFSAFCGFFSDNKGVMDFTGDDPANTSQEPGDALHGPSFADGGLQLETPNLFGDFTNDSLYVTLMIGVPFRHAFQVMMSLSAILRELCLVNLWFPTVLHLMDPYFNL